MTGVLVIENARVFAPQDRGVVDLVVAGERILALGPAAGAGVVVPGLQRIDGSGMLLLPGLVDSLTHPCGGGGEGGPGNRTAELGAQDFLCAGVTAPVGALGTDSLGRSLEVLYGKTQSLRAAGLRAYMYSGAYRVPPPTLSGDVARDIYLIEPLVGVGEVAISDHRGAQPDSHELRRLAADTQLGGILAGFGGTVMVHVGAGPARLAPLREAIAGSDLPHRVFYPTHVNRSTDLLDEAADWARCGGYVDITVSTTPELIAAGDIPAADALRYLLQAGAPAERITLSSDAGGSLPLYVDGELRGLTAARPDVLLELLYALWRSDQALFALALAGMSCNPAAALNLPERATLESGATADLLLVDSGTGRLAGVFCAGRQLLAI